MMDVLLFQMGVMAVQILHLLELVIDVQMELLEDLFVIMILVSGNRESVKCMWKRKVIVRKFSRSLILHIVQLPPLQFVRVILNVLINKNVV
jgi:hypothetical protein